MKKMACSSARTKTAKRQVSISTFKKWQVDFDREHQILSWLRCEVDQSDFLVDTDAVVKSLQRT